MKQKSRDNWALTLVILSAALAGGTSVYVKIGLKDIPPFTYTFLRFFLALVFFIPLIIKTKFKFNKESPKVFLISLFSTLNIILFSFGIRLTSASVGQLIYAAVPVFAVIVSHYLLKERITWQKVSGVFISLSGMLIIIVLPMFSARKVDIQGNALGNILILIGAISYTFYVVLSKKIQKKFSPIYITTVFFITTMAVSLFFSIFELMSFKNWGSMVTASSIFSLFYIAFFASAVAYLLGQYVIKLGTPIVASMTLYLQPVATVIWAFFVLGEIINGQFIFGGLLALFGAWLVSTSR